MTKNAFIEYLGRLKNTLDKYYNDKLAKKADKSYVDKEIENNRFMCRDIGTEENKIFLDNPIWSINSDNYLFEEATYMFFNRRVNTGAVTLKVKDKPEYKLLKDGHKELVAGDLKENKMYMVKLCSEAGGCSMSTKHFHLIPFGGADEPITVDDLVKIPEIDVKIHTTFEKVYFTLDDGSEFVIDNSKLVEIDYDKYIKMKINTRYHFNRDKTLLEANFPNGATDTLILDKNNKTIKEYREDKMFGLDTRDADIILDDRYAKYEITYRIFD